MITSIQNEKIKNLISLKDKKYRDLNNQFIIEGEHLVEEAYLTNNLIEVYTTDETFQLENIQVIYISQSIMAKISSQVSASKLIGLCRKQISREIVGNVLILDRIQDPGNLGTIIRNAVAFDIDTIIISNDSVDLYNDKVIRSTQGLIFKINIIISDLKPIINQLKNDGYQIIGSVVNGNNSLNNNQKFALIVGNEGKGISDEILALCDTFVTILINKNCESLNAGVASGILLYELSKVK